MNLPIAVDAMGGDHAPGHIVAGARRAADTLGVAVALVGRPGELAAIPEAEGLEVIAADDVVAMDAEAALAVRRQKGSSLHVAAEAVRDGRASAMVSAGNTGATMGTALLRMGRTKGVRRPAIATPIPAPGSTPTVLLDAGANAECQPDWLVQFAQMGSVFARSRFGVAAPRVALLANGEEPGKGTPLVKAAHDLLVDGAWAEGCGARFVGNVEGRDLMTDAADVVVTDGFTGNVALKTLEGGMRTLVGELYGVFSATEEAKAAAEVLLPALVPLAEQIDPDHTGGAMLLGVDGVCIISHGSSSATAVVNAVRVAAEMVEADVVGEIASVIRPERA